MSGDKDRQNISNFARAGHDASQHLLSVADQLSALASHNVATHILHRHVMVLTTQAGRIMLKALDAVGELPAESPLAGVAQAVEGRRSAAEHFDEIRRRQELLPLDEIRRLQDVLPPEQRLRRDMGYATGGRGRPLLGPDDVRAARVACRPGAGSYAIY